MARAFEGLQEAGGLVCTGMLVCLPEDCEDCLLAYSSVSQREVSHAKAILRLVCVCA